jgi:hypothetical protein
MSNSKAARCMLYAARSEKQLAVIDDYLLIILRETSHKKKERSVPASYASV